MEKLGPYIFTGLLGRGGMGAVYRGEHQQTGEIHAVKVLSPNYTHEAHFRSRFESEIHSLIKLDHPNIVRIISYGQEKGNLFFSMELIEGNSLFQMQKKGHHFDWREILSIAKDVCKGLRHAHDRGIIHRDLKPGNLLMAKDENGESLIKITDFGIAKSFGTSQNTGDNVLGTMDFMSPEQAKGQPVTFRSDLYSLGTLMFTLLSGRPPFSANSVEESLRNLTRVPAPKISTVRSDIPREIDKLIQRLMSKKPEDRIQTAQAMIYKIEECENLLIESSKAKTAEVPSAPDPRDETFEVSQPNADQTKANTDQKLKGARRTSDFESQTIGITENISVEPAKIRPAHDVDYFNTVTDRIRQIDTSPPDIDEHHSSGIVPILLALIAVLGIAGFGVYHVNKPPTADVLFFKVNDNIKNPDFVLDEISMFLKHYPDDSRVAEVEELEDVGESIKLYKQLTSKLSVRANLPGSDRLSDVEKQFMEIVAIADDDVDQAQSKMEAFATVYENDPTVSEEDQLCIDAAKAFPVKVRNDDRAKNLWKLEKIRSAMGSASEVTDDEKSILVYESIIELYGEIDWGRGEASNEGRKLVQKARMTLQKLKSAESEIQPDEDGEGDQ